jgi:hypothetical protein
MSWRRSAAAKTACRVPLRPAFRRCFRSILLENRPPTSKVCSLKRSPSWKTTPSPPSPPSPPPHKGCISDARACIDAAAALSPTTDALAALVSTANKAAASAQAVTLAARACIDHCNMIPRGTMTDADTSEAASAAVRTARLCRDTCSACLDALCAYGWGTSDLARACAAASPLLRTCRETIWQVLDAAGPPDFPHGCPRCKANGRRRRQTHRPPPQITPKPTPELMETLPAACRRLGSSPLFSGSLNQESNMDATLKELLIKSYGLDPNATDEQAIALLKSLKQRTARHAVRSVGGRRCCQDCGTR